MKSIFNNSLSKFLEFIAVHKRNGEWTDEYGIMCQATALYLERNIHIVGTANIGHSVGYTKLEGTPEAANYPPLAIGNYQDLHYQSLEEVKETTKFNAVVEEVKESTKSNGVVENAVARNVEVRNAVSIDFVNDGTLPVLRICRKKFIKNESKKIDVIDVTSNESKFVETSTENEMFGNIKNILSCAVAKDELFQNINSILKCIVEE